MRRDCMIRLSVMEIVPEHESVNSTNYVGLVYEEKVLGIFIANADIDPLTGGINSDEILSIISNLEKVTNDYGELRYRMVRYIDSYTDYGDEK